MAGAVIGGLLGMAFGATMAAGATFLGFAAGTMWILGAAVGSLFDQPSIDFGNSSPNYSFSEIYNTKTQLLPIPIVYGRVRMGGNIFLQQFYDDKRQKMDLFVGLSQGPINQVVSVYANEHVIFGDGSDTQTYWMLIDGEWTEGTYAEYVAFEGQKQIRDADGENPVSVDLKECSCDVHLGETGQPKDDREPGELTYPNLAYLGITLKVQEGLTGNPTITTELEGRKVWTPAGTRYTANPVWCIIDLLTNEHYGAGLPLSAFDIDMAEASAAYCDELVDGKPRYSLNYIIDQQRPVPDILRDMLMCFDGYIRERDKIEICVNRPVASPSRAIVVEDDAIQGTFTWWQKGREETYNRIVVEWIDPSNHYERTSTPFEAQDDIISRGVYERNISLLGVTDPYQAARLGEQALHIAQDIKNFCSFTVSVKDWDLEVGDVVSITESMLAGWSSKWFHVIDMQEDPASETASITLVEYNASSYVNIPSVLPTPIDNPSPPPTPDNYSNLLLTDVGSQRDDGTYVPKIRVRFTPPSADMKEHIINWWHSDDEVFEKRVSGKVRDALVSEGVMTGQTLFVRVWGTDVDDKPRTGVIGQIVPGRDDIAPGPPTSLTTTGWFGSIILNWVNPTTNEDGSPCVDLAYVEVWESSADNIETAVKIGEVNGTSYTRYLGSFVGRYYWVRAVDTSGNISQWNALAGTYGYSDLEGVEDFWDRIASDQILDALDELQTPIDSLAESAIWNALSDYDDAIAEMLQQRAQDKLAEAAINGELTNYNDMKWSLASIREERITREEEDMALASQILTIAAMLGDPDNPGEGTVYAALVEERTARVTADEALAQSIDTISAVIGDPWNPDEGTIYAAIRDERTARVNQDEALAQSIDALAATIGDPADPAPGTVYAAVVEEREARVTADSALASNITTLQTTVDGNTASVQQAMSSISGIKADWGVKVDVNGRVGGLKLIGGPTSTDMVFNVDSFIVQTPQGGVPPFMIGTVDGQTRTVIQDAFIQDAAISSAKIKDANVGTLKIEGNAVSVLAVASGDSKIDLGVMGSDTYHQVLSLTVSTLAGYPMMINFTCSSEVVESTMALRLTRNGSVLSGQNEIYITQFGYSGARFATAYTFVDKYPPGGNNTYAIYLKKVGGMAVRVFNRALTALHVKR